MSLIRGFKRRFSPFLEKLTITSLSSNPNDAGKITSRNEKETFVVMFNPGSYSLHYENKYNKSQGINTSGKQAEYVLSYPQKLSLTLIFDDTGVTNYLTSSSIGPDGIGNIALNTLGSAASGIVPVTKYTAGPGDIYAQVQRFINLTTKLNSQVHEPNFLEVSWGDLIFDCRLETVDVRYTLFTRSGQPLRAELDVVFIGDIKDEKRVRGDNLQSPDMTHVREIKSGDTLPLMALGVYSDPSYYIQLAHVNKLNNFRKLKTGSTIKLPPIKK